MRLSICHQDREGFLKNIIQKKKKNRCISTHIFIATNQGKITLKKNMAKENGLSLTFLSPNSSSSFP